MRTLDLAYAPFVLFGGGNVTAAKLGDDELAVMDRAYTTWRVVEGAPRLRRPGAAMVLASGACVLLPPGSGWSLHLAAGDVVAHVVFDVIHRERILRRPARWPGPGAPPQPGPEAVWGIDLPVPLPAALWPAARRLATEVNRLWWVSDLDHLRANQVLGAWLLDLVEALRCDGHPPPADPLDRAEAWARDHLDVARVGSMAEAAGMSRTRFCARYRQERGRTPGSWLDAARIAVAIRRLGEGQRPLKRVAAAVGWRKVETLRRRLREWLGHDPL